MFTSCTAGTKQMTIDYCKPTGELTNHIKDIEYDVVVFTGDIVRGKDKENFDQVISKIKNNGFS